MKILFLAHRSPFPPNKGDKIRSYQMLRHLVAEHDVTVVAVCDGAADRSHLEALGRTLQIPVHGAEIPAVLAPLRAAASACGRRPLTNGFFYSPSLQRLIDSLLATSTFDLVIAYSSPMAEYLRRSAQSPIIARTPKIMDLIDVDSLKWRDYADSAAAPRRWMYEYEHWAQARYEADIVARFDHVLLTSESEADILRWTTSSRNALAVSNGVDLDYFRPSEPTQNPAEAPLMVFTGVMDYKPNAEGVCWFARSILPRIRARMPHARFCIVGARPNADVLRLSELPGVEVTGYVDDVRDYLRRAAVSVAPLQIARGVQNKVLEAMACGKPVVTTSGGALGIHAEAGRDLIVADQAAEFAASVVRLLQNRECAARLGSNARAAVERHHSWPASLRPLDELIARNAQGPPGP